MVVQYINYGLFSAGQLGFTIKFSYITFELRIYMNYSLIFVSLLPLNDPSLTR